MEENVMLNGVVAMGKLLDYLKSHRREEANKRSIISALLSAFCAYSNMVWQEELWLGVMWVIIGVLWFYQAFFTSDKERAMEKEMADDRPLDIRLREAFADYTPMQLQAILDDDLRSEEVKGIAGEMLKERQMEA